MTSQTRILLNYWTFLTENEKLTSFSLSLQKPKLIISVAQTELYYFVNTYREKNKHVFNQEPPKLQDRYQLDGSWLLSNLF